MEKREGEREKRERERDEESEEVRVCFKIYYCEHSERMGIEMQNIQDLTLH